MKTKAQGNVLFFIFIGVAFLALIIALLDTPIQERINSVCNSNYNFLFKINDNWVCLEIPMAEMYLESNTVATPLTANTPSKVYGKTVLNTHSAMFTMPDNNTLTYTGAYDSLCHTANTLSVRSSGANDVVKAYVAVNGVKINGSQITTKLAQVGDVTSTAIHTAPYLTYGDNVSFYVVNPNNNNDYTIFEMNMFIMCYPMS